MGLQAGGEASLNPLKIHNGTVPYFNIRYFLFAIYYALFQSLYFELTGHYLERRLDIRRTAASGVKRIARRPKPLKRER